MGRYLREGYIVVCQDVRGRYASDGTWESWLRPQTHDAEDGYDTVQWAAGLPGATGKVGTIGFSYGAFYQYRLAACAPALGASAHSTGHLP
jgi:putative CocE/NonD family hydrolase